MIPVSIGKTLVEYIKIWIMSNPKLRDNISDINRFVKWEGEILVDFQQTYDYYRNRFIIADVDNYCDGFSKKMESVIAKFLADADFRTEEMTLNITFKNVGMSWCRKVKVGKVPRKLNVVG